MSKINAVYRHGVFQPLDPVDFQEEQRVRLNVEPATTDSANEWLAEVQALQASIVERQGVLPDSTADIAADRMR